MPHTHTNTHTWQTQHVTAAARSGLRWQVSSKLKASGSSTVSDCGSYGGSVGGFVPQHCCVRTLVALNNCLPPFASAAIRFVCPRHTHIPYISVYMCVCVWECLHNNPTCPFLGSFFVAASDCCLFWGLMFLSLLHLFAYCAPSPNVCCD